MNRKATLVALGLSAALLGGNAVAATTTLTGTYVSYTFDDADLGLFGTASLSGDDLVFAPTNFTAFSANGLPGAAVHTLHIDVSAHSGYLLSAINLTESGGYSLSGTAAAFVTGNITALDTEGTASNQVIGNIVPSALLDVNGTATNWSADAGIVLPASGWGGGDGVVNGVGLMVTNQLFATTGPGGTAEVWKNAVGLHVVTSPVPEAQTYAMLLAGLGLVGLMVRRSRRAQA